MNTELQTISQKHDEVFRLCYRKPLDKLNWPDQRERL